MSGYSETDLLADVIDGLEVQADRLQVSDKNREDVFSEWSLLVVYAKRLRGIADEFEAKLATSIPKGERILLGGVPYKYGRDSTYTQWQNDDLRRAVLDSVLVDRETGEIKEETPADKLAHVWSLAGSGARRTALIERGIQPDEYAAFTWGRARLREIR